MSRPRSHDQRVTRGGAGPRARSLTTLPKAHLHLHFTGSMRHPTLLELAERDGISLPDSLVERVAAPALGGRREGLVPVPAALRRGPVGPADPGRRTPAGPGGRGGRPARRRSLAGDPGRSLGVRRPFGGITAFTDLVLDAVRDASATTGLGIAVVIAANRTRHPLDARTLARLAAQYAGRGVVGFGLSNDERRGVTDRLRARRSRSPSGPACSSCRTVVSWSGPASVRPASTSLHAHRLGHGVRSVEDPDAPGPVADARHRARDLPRVQRRARGVLRPDLGAPAEPCSRPARPFASAPTTRCCSARGWPRSTPRCARPTSSPTRRSPSLAAMSVAASCAPDDVKRRCSSNVADWLSAETGSATMAP